MPAPSQRQLLLPFLTTLAQSGGRAPAKTVRDAIADRVGVDVATRTARIPHHGASAWGRTVRWVQQYAKSLGLTTTDGDGHWALTPAGRQAVTQAPAGQVVIVCETAHGQAVWASCADAARALPDGEARLILTSPPYPLLRPKAYANQYAADAHVEWLVGEVRTWLPKLSETQGTLLLNVGPTWLPGVPAQSCWEEELVVRLRRELGLFKLQRFAWHNPSQLPSPAPWVTRTRLRVTDSLETCYAFGRRPDVPWDTRAVLTPYSASMQQRLRAGGESRARRRPSGHAVAAGAFGVDHGGAIPKSLLAIPNTASRDAYSTYCASHGLPVHPARFPARLAEFFVSLCTRVHDLVWDPFAGSLTVAAVCERLRRRWFASDLGLEYLVGGAGGRLQAAAGFVDGMGLPGRAVG